MAAALQINRVQSNKCWFLTTGNIFAAITKTKRQFKQVEDHSLTAHFPIQKKKIKQSRSSRFYHAQSLFVNGNIQPTISFYP